MLADLLNQLAINGKIIDCNLQNKLFSNNTMQCLGRMCVTECFLPLIVENLLLSDRVERISIELLPLLLYTVDHIYIYKNYETFPCVLYSMA